MGVRLMADNTLEMLAQHEEKIRDLYLAYADKFPGMAEFWKEMAKEENWHAQVIREAVQKEAAVNKSLPTPRFKPELLKTSMFYMEKEILRAKEDTMAEINALAVALDIEKSMLERRFFEAFDSSTTELKQAMKMLLDATKVHFERINAEVTRARGER
jgi:rubrerythrin